MRDVAICVNVHVTMIRDIDTLLGSFYMSGFLNLMWNVRAVSEEWSPDIIFTNSLGKVYCDVIDASSHNGMCSNTVVFSGTFSEVFEVDQFPIDYQRLSVHIKFVNCPANGSSLRYSVDTTYSPLRVVSPMSPYTTRSGAYSTTFADLRFRLVVGETKMAGDCFMENGTWCVTEGTTAVTTKSRFEHDPLQSNKEYCKLILETSVRRRPQHYYFYFVVPLFIQTMASFSVFALPACEFGEKTQLTLSVMLTMVAIKFAISSYLPAVSTVTYIEMYFMKSLFTVALVIIQTFVMYIMCERDDLDTTLINRWTCIPIISVSFAIDATVTVFMFSPRLVERIIRPMIDGKRLVRRGPSGSNYSSSRERLGWRGGGEAGEEEEVDIALEGADVRIRMDATPSPTAALASSARPSVRPSVVQTHVGRPTSPSFADNLQSKPLSDISNADPPTTGTTTSDRPSKQSAMMTQSGIIRFLRSDLGQSMGDPALT